MTNNDRSSAELRNLARGVERVLGEIVGFRRRPNKSPESSSRDPDLEQAWLRVGIGSFAFAYAWALVLSGGVFTPGLVTSVVASGTAAVVGAWMVRRIRRSKDHIVALRFLGIFTDMAAITIAMAGANEGGVPFVGFYLWVTVGNGFRYGPRYLLAAYWLSLFGYSCLLLFVPFWIEHRAFSLGLLVVLGVVPLYVLVLLTRLTAQKDAAEQLSNAKSRFVANVSHELRTPLTGIAAVYELLCARRLSPDDRELVGMLGSAVATLRASVDAVLLMSKLEAGAEAAEKAPFCLWYFLQQLGALVRPQSISKGVAWGLHIDPTLPSTVVGDQNHLGHILGNLLNNAFKFTSSGSVTLRALPAGTGVIRFEVVDTGIGISHEDQERLFERFVQVDTSPLSKHGGTGLGTSIARDLAELMGGRIGVISAPGNGSTFWVELPLAESGSNEVVRDWAPWREVVVVGGSGAREAEAARVIRALGLEPVIVNSGIHDVRIFDSQRYLAAFLLMDAGQAATFAETVLVDRTGAACPWMVLASDVTPAQQAALVQRGAAAILDSRPPEEAVARVLFALKNSLQAGATRLGQALPSAGVGLNSLTILLADDNRSNAFLMSRILGDAGHTVQTADSGSAAFDMLAGHSFDLAILDLNMPDMSGPDVTKLFRAASIGTAKIPIIIMSADATPAARRESLEAGADEFLTKPITGATLIAAIERIVVGTQMSAELASENGSGRGLVSGSTPAQQLIDQERVQALERLARGDENFLDRYISAAFGELEDAIAGLREALESNDIRAARDSLHIIEGTGGSIGAVALVANCRALRESLQRGGVGDRAQAMAEMSTTYALTKSTIISGSQDKSSLDRIGQMIRERPSK